MPTIDKLSPVDSVVAADLVPIFSSANDDARSATMQVLADFFGSQVSNNFQQTGTDAVIRTYQDKESDIFSVRDFTGSTVDGVTSNQVGITNAVNAAMNASAVLYWPAGTYVSTENIPNLHSVRHIGPGAIKRGSVLFYVEPKEGQTNTLNVAATGSAANDGLGTGQPMATFQNAFDALANYGPVLRGLWNVVAAAGTYSFSGGAQTLSTASVNRVTIRGPAVGGHPNVPTCIIDGTGGGAFSHGLRLNTGTYATFKDIKAVNFSGGGATRIGFLADVGSDLYAENCHNASGGTWAGLFASSSTLRLSGGIWEGAQWGIGLYNSRFTIGYNGAAGSNRPIIRNSTQAGVSLQAISMGHIDWCDLTDNPTQITLEGNSRAHIMGCAFTRGAIHVQSDNGATYYNDQAVGFTNNFNIGGADGATQATFVNGADAGESNEGGTSQSIRRVAYDRTFRTVSGVASGAFPTIYTMPAARLQGVGKSLRVKVYGVYTMTAGNTLTVNIGGMALTLAVPAAATAETFSYEVVLHEVQGGYRSFGELKDSLSAGRMGNTGTGFVNTVANAVSIGYNLTGAGDSLNIYRTDVEIIG